MYYYKQWKGAFSMGETSENKPKKHICIGILAHVDAGKTTLSEGMLYLSGSIRRLGRVDNKDAFLDTFDLERERGITIFSKQARFSTEGMEVTLLDTPGHVDFSAEMERTLQVLDYAILVVSGADGVQGHTQTLWRLLKKYQIPTFLFINKMDQEGTEKSRLLAELNQRLHENCVDFGEDDMGKTDSDSRGSENRRQPEFVVGTEQFLENIAMCDVRLLENYLEGAPIYVSVVAKLIAERKLFPCYFGSALKLTGVQEFMQGLERYTLQKQYPQQFGAKVYKIARDAQGNRLTYLKVTGGTLKVKDLLTNDKTQYAGAWPAVQNTETTVGQPAVQAAEIWEEKVNQIRIYSGAKYESVNETPAGCVCAVTGLSHTCPGEGLGTEAASDLPILEPVLNYQIQLPPDCEVHQMLANLRQLEEEEPLLHIVWEEQLGEIHAQLMGEVQIEVLKRLIWDRFGVRVEFGTGRIVYKETIAGPVVGVGHFEPLKHYAEVHLLMEPGETGSGLQFFTDCSEDVLDRNWQRLILTHLEEKEHKGVLTGSPVTDMRITLIAGRAHQKHTEGGDFRQATYRAVRQGLKKAKSVLLEPYYEFRIEVPTEMIGRALNDVQRMNGNFEPPAVEGELAVLTGSAPVAAMQGYQTELISYTKGKGRLFCTLQGYRPCQNAEEVIAAAGYDSERDMDNPTGSVFCAHGAGFVVKWDEVEQYMHIASVTTDKEANQEHSGQEQSVQKPTYSSGAVRRASTYLELSPEDEREIERMVEASRQKREQARKKYSYRKEPVEEGKAAAAGYANTKEADSRKKEYLLADGYNIIFAWEELRELAEENIDAARGRLMDILCNYQGMKKCELILVFDAYKLEGFPGEVQKYHNIYVVYTKEAETADQYIEKVAHEIGRRYHVTVATSDGTEQVIIRGQGCYLMSAQELKTEVEQMNEQLRREHTEVDTNSRNYLFHYLKKEDAKSLENIRLGKK